MAPSNPTSQDHVRRVFEQSVFNAAKKYRTFITEADFVAEVACRMKQKGFDAHIAMPPEGPCRRESKRPDLVIWNAKRSPSLIAEFKFVPLEDYWPKKSKNSKQGPVLWTDGGGVGGDKEKLGSFSEEYGASLSLYFILLDSAGYFFPRPNRGRQRTELFFQSKNRKRPDFGQQFCGDKARLIFQRHRHGSKWQMVGPINK